MKRHTRAEVLRQGAYVEWVKAYEAESQRDQLREALDRTLHNFELILSQKPVRDAAETIAEARAALKATEEG